MSKGSFIAIVALLVAIAGAIVAFAAYFRRHGCSDCDGMDDFLGDEDDMNDLDYFATQLDDEEMDDDVEEGGCSCGSCGCKNAAEESVAQPAPEEEKE